MAKLGCWGWRLTYAFNDMVGGSLNVCDIFPEKSGIVRVRKESVDLFSHDWYGVLQDLKSEECYWLLHTQRPSTSFAGGKC